MGLLILADSTFKDGDAAESGPLGLNLRHGLRCVFVTLALEFRVALDPHGTVHFAAGHFEQFLERVVGNLSVDALVSQLPEIFAW